MRRILCTFALALTLTGCRSETPEPATPATSATEENIPFRAEGTLSFRRDGRELVSIRIEVADTDSARARGLMQRTSLPERSGMLFVFNREEPQSFWMANTPLALDIFFVGADSQIVSIAKYTRPLSPRNIESGAPAQYVVETPAGFADTHGIAESDRVTWRVGADTAAVAEPLR